MVERPIDRNGCRRECLWLMGRVDRSRIDGLHDRCVLIGRCLLIEEEGLCGD
jgi:hypothetical protein